MVLNLTSREAAKAISGIVITAAYRIDPVFYWKAITDWGLALPLYGNSFIIAIGIFALVVAYVVASVTILSK